MSNDVDLSQLAINRDNPAATRVRSRRHLLTRYILPGALAMGFLALIVWSVRDFVFPARPVKVVPVLVTNAQVQRAGTPLFKAAGWIQPRPTAVRVAALAPGVIDRLLVVEDQLVKAGQPIAYLVSDDARLAKNRAAADLKLRQAEQQQARATLKSATVRFNQPVQLQASLADAEAKLAKVDTDITNLPFGIRRAEARLKLAKQDLAGKLKAQGVIAGIVIAESRSEVETAVALVEELRQRDGSLKKEKAALATRRDALDTQLRLKADETQDKDEAAAKVAAATARVEQAQAVVDEAKLRLDRMTVSSPIDGRVLHLVSEPGTRLIAGMSQTPTHDGSTVVTMYRPEMLQVRVDVRFEDLPRVQLGQPVTIESPAISAPLRGEVLFISSLADIQKNTLEVKVAIHQPPPVFKPQMLVDVTFLAPKQADSPSAPSEQLRLLVPNQLVQRGESGSFVWVADLAAGVARRVAVKTGLVGTNGLVEITGGLNAASRLMTTGTEGLRDGDRIRVIDDENLGTSVEASTPQGTE